MRYIPKALVLGWQAQPVYFCALIILLILQGAQPLVQAWIAKSVIDNLSMALDMGTVTGLRNGLAGSSLGSLAQLILCYGLLSLATQLLATAVQYIQTELGEDLTRRVNLLIIDKTNSFADITPFENPGFYDLLQQVQGEASFRPVTVVQALAYLFRNIVAGGAALAILLAYQPLLVLVVTMLALPALISGFKSGQQKWSIRSSQAPQVREMNYFSSLLTSSQSAKEVRLFGLQTYFKERYLNLFDTFRQELSRVRRAQLLRESLVAGVGAGAGIVAYTYTVLKTLNGQISLGSLTFYLSATTQFQNALGVVVSQTANLYESSLFLSQFFDFLTLPSNLNNTEESHQTKESDDSSSNTIKGWNRPGLNPGLLNRFGRGRAGSRTRNSNRARPAVVEITTKGPPPRLTRGITFREVEFAYPLPVSLPNSSQSIRKPTVERAAENAKNNAGRMATGLGKAVLKGISFHIEAGQTVAIVGENGAGKTTLVKLLSRLYEPTAGSIEIDGVDLREYDRSRWQEQLAVVLQDFGRYQLSAQENIGLGQFQQLQDLDQIRWAAGQAGALKLIEKLPASFQTRLGRLFAGRVGSPEYSSSVELSGGEWQKIALARAFMRTKSAEEGQSEGSHPQGLPADNTIATVEGNNPVAAQLLILDEPTAALDAAAEEELFERFRQITQGKTTLLISHRFSTIKMADKIVLLKDGRVAEEGTHHELIEKGGEYARLYNLQAQRYQENTIQRNLLKNTYQ